MIQTGFKQPDSQSEFFGDLVTFPLGGGCDLEHRHQGSELCSLHSHTCQCHSKVDSWLLENGLCTYALLKTANEVQVGSFNCQPSPVLLRPARPGPPREPLSVLQGELVPGFQQPPALYRRGRSLWVGHWAGADLPVGGEKRWAGRAGLWRRQADIGEGGMKTQALPGLQLSLTVSASHLVV